MPRRTAPLKQQSLIGFLNPNSSKTSSPRDPTKPGQARLASRVPPRPSEPSDQSGTDSGVDAIHFEPRRVVISDDDDIQLSSPVRKRRTAVEVESHADRGVSKVSISSDLDDDVGTNRKATSSVKIRRHVSRSPSTELESPLKRRRLARGARPSSPLEESDNLLDEVDEGGNHSIGPCQVTTNTVRRYYSISLS
jgi:hypothetical protein